MGTDDGRLGCAGLERSSRRDGADGRSADRASGGDRVLRLHIEGTLDVRIPDGIEEDGDTWDDWLEAVIQSALLDGRWQACTGVDVSEVGILDVRGEVRRV